MKRAVSISIVACLGACIALIGWQYQDFIFQATDFLGNLIATKVFHPALLNNAVILVAGFAFTFALEMLIVDKGKSSFLKLLSFSESTRYDVFCFLLILFNIYNLVGAIFTFGIVWVFLTYVKTHISMDIVEIRNIWIYFVYFILWDFLTYVTHAIPHKFPRLFGLHAFHHAAADMTILNAVRSHPAEAAINKLVIFFPLLIIFGDLELILLFHLLTSLHSQILHSGISSNWGFVGRYLLVSPASHRVHHSTLTKHFGKNLGNHLIIWDRIFNTYFEVTNSESKNLKFGLTNYNLRSDLWGSYWNFILLRKNES